MNLCPLDEKDDAIQRVQTLIWEDHVYSSRNGSASSAISSLLAPPEPPKRLGFGFYMLWCFVLLLPAVVLLPLVFPLLFWLKKYRVEHAKRKGYAQNYELWEKAVAKWDRLFYCHRCGITFDPQTGAWCMPRELGEFLYREE
jgi:hypothetical protein